MNKKIRYTFIILIACIMISSSILIPGVLIKKSTNSMLGRSYTASNGYNLIERGKSDGSIQPSQIDKLLEEMPERVWLFQKNEEKSTLSRQDDSVSISMEEAVDICVNQISMLLNKKMLLTSSSFPNAYNVHAELRSITDSKRVLQYWSISFSLKNSAPYGTDNDIDVYLDAQTGIILEFRMLIGSSNNTMNLANITKAIAQEMNISGHLISLDEEKDLSTAIWMMDKSSILMKVTLSGGKDKETQNPLFKLYMNLYTNTLFN